LVLLWQWLNLIVDHEVMQMLDEVQPKKSLIDTNINHADKTNHLKIFTIMLFTNCSSNTG
jgi:hypothetical protein